MRLLYILLSAVILMASCRTAEQQKRAYMRRTFHTLRKTVKEAEVSNLDDSVKVIFPSNLMFGFNSAQIKEDLKPSIRRLSKALNKFNKTAILIAGHTDNVGDDEYNDKLSAQRADSAKAALSAFEVNPMRITTWGMGKKHPIAGNETEEGRAKNRRVEFVVLYEVKK